MSSAAAKVVEWMAAVVEFHGMGEGEIWMNYSYLFVRRVDL
jgi:hypothetical protein